jgi:hypothetical protein
VPPKSVPSNGPVSSHEARIQRLEDHVSELKASHAEVSTNLHNLGVQVTDMGTRISDKIDAVVKPLHDTLHDHIKEDTLSRDKLNVVEATVNKIEDERQSRAKRSKALLTAIYAVCTGAAAIGLKELVVWMAHLHH